MCLRKNNPCLVKHEKCSENNALLERKKHVM